MRAQVHQLRSELKIRNKGNQSIYVYVLGTGVIDVSLLAIGDPIFEREKIDVILQGHPE